MCCDIRPPLSGSRLLALPTELRLVIYELVFQDTEVTIQPCGRWNEPAILQVNKQILLEASATYYKLCRFHIALDGEQCGPFAFAQRAGPDGLARIRNMTILIEFSLSEQHPSMCIEWRPGGDEDDINVLIRASAQESVAQLASLIGAGLRTPGLKIVSGFWAEPGVAPRTAAAFVYAKMRDQILSILTAKGAAEGVVFALK